MSYTLPAVTVRQDFQLIPSAVVENQKACVIGPRRTVVRSGISDAALLSYGAYDPDLGNDLTLKGLDTAERAELADIDLALTDVLAEWAVVAKADFEEGSRAAIIKSKVPGYGWKTVSTGDTEYPLMTGLNNRGVRVGDRVRVNYTVPETNPSIVSKVLAVNRSRGTTTVGTVTPGANNIAANASQDVALTVVQFTGTTPSASDFVVTGAIKGLLNRVMSDTISVECTTIGGEGVGVYRVTSSTQGFSRLIPLSDVGTGDLGVVVAAPSGGMGYTINLQAVIDKGTDGANHAGDEFTLTIDAAHTRALPVITMPGGSLVDLAYRLRVVSGGTGTTARFTATTLNGVDSSGPVTIDTAALPIGRLGLLIKADAGGDTFVTGDEYTVAITGAAEAAADQLVLADPVLWSATPLTIDLLVYVAEQEIPSIGYPLESTEAWALDEDGRTITLESGLQITSPTALDESGNEVALDVVSASIRIEHASVKAVGAPEMGIVSSLATLEPLLGPAVPENELAYGVDKALQNSGGQPVEYCRLAGGAMEDYQAALVLLESSQSVYSLAPTTQDDQIIGLMKAHVLEMSGETRGRERGLVVSRRGTTRQDLYVLDDEDSPWTGNIGLTDDSAAYSKLTVPGASFTEDLLPGDIVETDFSIDIHGEESWRTFTVDEVVDNETAVLVEDAGAAIGDEDDLVAVRIVRNKGLAEEAAGYADLGNSLGSRRVVNVFPYELVADDDILVPGWAAAAALAGLASSVVPHQPLTRVEVSGFKSAPKTLGYFGIDLLNTIAEGGNMILIQDTPTGPVYIRHQVTTDMTDINSQEWSVTRNLDSIAKFLRGSVEPFIGRYNIHDGFLGMLDALIRDRIDYLTRTSLSLSAGPQVLSLREEGYVLAQDPLIRTKVRIVLPIELPYPFNNADITLLVV